MKKNRKNSGIQKEKIFMIGASVFVLTALTLTGVYVSDQGESGKNGNIIDFTELEEQAQNSNQEDTEKKEAEELISQANSMDVENQKRAENNQNSATNKVTNQDKYGNTSSNLQKKKYGEQTIIEDTTGQMDGKVKLQEGIVETNAEASPVLHFRQEDGLSWPIAGQVLLNYSMDKAIFYKTMQQYRYNPSIVIGATVGEPITAAADGKVESVFHDAELGQGIMCSLGDDYELTYGQLKDIAVSEGQMVKEGDLLGYVAEPSIYYSEEGSNVYFKLTHAGTPVDPITILE